MSDYYERWKKQVEEINKKGRPQRFAEAVTEVDYEN